MFPPSLSACLAWYVSGDESRSPGEICASRDVFQARLDSSLRGLLQIGWSSDEAALLTAVLGELGNNAFDHNIGQWPDVAGCWFGREPDYDPPLFWVVDRGVGILSTLRRADPALTTPEQAIEAAFLRVLSGRAPEQRGNGLKFVRSVVNGYGHRALLCQSAGASTEFGGPFSLLSEAKGRLDGVPTPGVFAVLAWRNVS